MEYYKEITLRDGEKCILRSFIPEEYKQVWEVFIITHTETDNNRTYPEECGKPDEEHEFINRNLISPNSVEMGAFVGGRLAGSAGFEAVGDRKKDSHRAELGIGLTKEFWGRGIGRGLMEACIDCAKKAGFTQLELSVVSTNRRAISLYKAVGFEEFGRNPRGFRKKNGEYQELIHMLLPLD